MEFQNLSQKSNEEINAEKLCNLVFGNIVLSTKQNALQDRIMKEMKVGDVRIYHDHKSGEYLLMKFIGCSQRGLYNLKCLDKKNSNQLPNN